MSAVGWQRMLRKGLFGLALMGTLLALIYAEENWRAARDWASCERTLEARGEMLDFSAHEGPPVPRDRNLAFLPFFKRWGVYRVDPATGRVIFLAQTPPPDFADLPRLKGDMLNKFPGIENYDLSAWQRYFQLQEPGGEPLPPGLAVLRALERFRPLLAELAAARDAMPDGEFLREYNLPLSEWGTFGGTPELGLNCALMLRASALLAASRPTDAWHDIELAFWLQRATGGRPPILLPLMIGVAQLAPDHAPIRNGLVSDGWTTEQVAALQTNLQRIDLLTDYSHAMRGERDFVLGIIDAFMRDHPAQSSSASDWQERALERLLFLVSTNGPRGWLIQNKVAASRWFQSYLSACDAPAHRIYPERLRTFNQQNQAGMSWPRPDRYLVRNLTFFLGQMHIQVVAEEQSQVDVLIIACALKRYALAHGGNYPAALSELVPQFIDRVPAGVRDGKPMHYQTTPDGHYQLTVNH